MLVKQVCFADIVVFAGMCRHVPSVQNFSKLLKSDRNTYFSHISSLTSAPEITLKHGYFVTAHFKLIFVQTVRTLLLLLTSCADARSQTCILNP